MILLLVGSVLTSRGQAEIITEDWRRIYLATKGQVQAKTQDKPFKAQAMRYNGSQHIAIFSRDYKSSLHQIHTANYLQIYNAIKNNSKFAPQVKKQTSVKNDTATKNNSTNTTSSNSSNTNTSSSNTNSTNTNANNSTISTENNSSTSNANSNTQVDTTKGQIRLDLNKILFLSLFTLFLIFRVIVCCCFKQKTPASSQSESTEQIPNQLFDQQMKLPQAAQ